MLINKTLRLNNLKFRAAINAKNSVFVICVEAIIYLLLYNLSDCTFKRTRKSLLRRCSRHFIPLLVVFIEEYSQLDLVKYVVKNARKFFFYINMLHDTNLCKLS